MDVLKDAGDELGIHACERSLSTTLVQNLVVAVGLQDRHIVCLLILTNLTTYLHATGQHIHDLIVEFVNLLTQLCNAFCRGVLVADNEQ